VIASYVYNVIKDRTERQEFLNLLNYLTSLGRGGNSFVSIRADIKADTDTQVNRLTLHNELISAGYEQIKRSSAFWMYRK
jgi:hypothetical protein